MAHNEKIRGIWESQTSQFQISEAASSEVDGEIILARVVGPAFFPNTTSRNNVFYPEEAWENALNKEELQYRLKNRLILGTIGHDIEIDDNAVRDGEFSHIVTNLWIEDGVGKAEYLILNTRPGKVLNTLLRAKCGLRVSTKANGLFSGSSSTGSNSVDPDNFELDRIDFVLDPGYREAFPSLVESFYSEKLNKKYSQVSEDQSVISSIKERVLKSEVEISENKVKELESQLESIKKELDRYKQFGSVSAISESYKTLSNYLSIGSPKQINSIIEESLKNLSSITEAEEDDLEELGSDEDEFNQDDVEDFISDLDESPESDETNTDNSLDASPEDLKELAAQAELAIDKLNQYAELGDPKTISDIFSQVSSLIDVAKDSQIIALSEALKIPKEELRKLAENCSTISELADDLVDKYLPETDSETTYNKLDQESSEIESAIVKLAEELNNLDVPEICRLLVHSNLLFSPLVSLEDLNEFDLTEEDILEVLDLWSYIVPFNFINVRLAIMELSFDVNKLIKTDEITDTTSKVDTSEVPEFNDQLPDIVTSVKPVKLDKKITESKKIKRLKPIKESDDLVDLNQIESESLTDDINKYYKFSESNKEEKEEPVDEEVVKSLEKDILSKLQSDNDSTSNTVEENKLSHRYVDPPAIDESMNNSETYFNHNFSPEAVLKDLDIDESINESTPNTQPEINSSSGKGGLSTDILRGLMNSTSLPNVSESSVSSGSNILAKNLLAGMFKLK